MRNSIASDAGRLARAVSSERTSVTCPAPTSASGTINVPGRSRAAPVIGSSGNGGESRKLGSPEVLPSTAESSERVGVSARASRATSAHSSAPTASAAVWHRAGWRTDLGRVTTPRLPA
jgi:hypothetical protein